MNDDAALLHAYAAEGSETAFTALVRRHIDLVYAAALRRVDGDAHLAADVAQQVFATLARQLQRSWRPQVLSAWLHTATRNAATNTMTSEKRRRIREQAAFDPALAPEETTPEWERIKPVLDAAIDELPEPDRAAVVLRFLEKRAFGEIGVALQISADAARMRTERALDKLRALLAKRGITSTASAVGAIISSQPAISAPAGLVASAAATALTAGAAGVSTLGLLAYLMKLKTFVTGIALLAAFGAGIYVGLIQHLDLPLPPIPETPPHSRTIAALRQENIALRDQIEKLRTTPASPSPSAAPAPTVSSPAAPPSETVARQKARAMFATLLQLSLARDQFQREHGRAPASLEDLVGPDKYMKIDLKPLLDEGYAQVSLVPGEPMTVRSPEGISAILNPDGSGATFPAQETPLPRLPPRPPGRAPGQPVRVYAEQASTPLAETPLSPRVSELTQQLAPAMQKAMNAYVAAHGARPRENEAGYAALIPYFSNPQEGADFVELIEGLKQAGRLR